jgi:hypothetical protein
VTEPVFGSSIRGPHGPRVLHSQHQCLYRLLHTLPHFQTSCCRDGDTSNISLVLQSPTISKLLFRTCLNDSTFIVGDPCFGWLVHGAYWNFSYLLDIFWNFKLEGFARFIVTVPNSCRPTDIIGRLFELTKLLQTAITWIMPFLFTVVTLSLQPRILAGWS